LTDAEAIALEAAGTVPRARAYDAFKAWCRRNERRALGSHTFYGEIRRSGGRYGVSERRDPHSGWELQGVRLLFEGVLGDD